jgi:hypothetical protein
VVRDGSAWYALTSVPPNATGAYRILVFHFAEGSNASGFVAWLAGIIKKEAGTGVMVVCGFDTRATPALWQPHSVCSTTGDVHGAGAMKWLRLWSDCVVRVRTDCYVWQSPSPPTRG